VSKCVVSVALLRFVPTATSTAGSDASSTPTPAPKASWGLQLECGARLLPVALLYAGNNCLVLYVLSKLQLSSFVVWRHSSTVFNAILWVAYFKRDLHPYKVVGIVCFVVACCLISIQKDGSWEPLSLPVILVLCSAALSAAASVFNEGVLKAPKFTNVLGTNHINALLYFETSTILACVITCRCAYWKLQLMSAFTTLDKSAATLIVVQAVLGLVVSRVLVYADSVSKVMIGGAREVLTLLIAPFFVSSRFDWISMSAGLWVSLALMVYFACPDLSPRLEKFKSVDDCVVVQRPLGHTRL